MMIEPIEKKIMTYQNPGPNHFVCSNGIVDLTTGAFLPAYRGDYQGVSCRTPWRGLHKPAQLWRSALMEIFDDDEVVLDYLQRLFGMILLRSGGFTGVIPVFAGPGKGKNLVLSVVSQVLGPDLSCGVDLNTASSSKATFSLNGYRMVCANLDETCKPESIKFLGFCDRLIGNAKNGSLKVYNPTHTLFLTTNIWPLKKIENDYSVLHRVHVVLFPEFADAYDNQDCLEELEQEYSGILAWMVQGCLEWQKKGLWL